MGGSALAAEDPRRLIRRWKPGLAHPPATLADVAWLQGSWVGDMPLGPVENVILPPFDGQMPSFVRAQQKGHLLFYEITAFVEAEGSLLSRVRHFSPEYSAWESAVIERPLIAFDRQYMYFDGQTYERHGPDHYTVYHLNIRDGQEQDTIVVPFARKPA